MAAFDSSVWLQRLIQMDRVRVHQKTTMNANKYVILAEAGDVLFTAKEKAGLGVELGMDLVDASGRTVITLRRPYCMGQSKLKVSVCGQLASVVRQESTFFKPVLSVNDASDAPVLRVKGPASVGRKADFEVLALNKQKIGCISKEWSGFMKEMFTCCDSFIITFPQDLDVRYKAALIGTCLLIDHLYYQNKEN